jgi:hypothetical protein
MLVPDVYNKKTDQEGSYSRHKSTPQPCQFYPIQQLAVLVHLRSPT